MKCSSCSINDGQLKLEEAVLTKAMLENTKCFLLDCGAEIYVWVGRVTQMEDRKSATKAVEVNSCTVFLSSAPTPHPTHTMLSFIVGNTFMVVSFSGIPY